MGWPSLILACALALCIVSTSKAELVENRKSILTGTNTQVQCMGAKDGSMCQAQALAMVATNDGYMDISNSQAQAGRRAETGSADIDQNQDHVAAADGNVPVRVFSNQDQNIDADKSANALPVDSGQPGKNPVLDVSSSSAPQSTSPDTVVNYVTSSPAAPKTSSEATTNSAPSGQSSSSEALPSWFSEASPVTQSSNAAPLTSTTTESVMKIATESTTIGQYMGEFGGNNGAVADQQQEVSTQTTSSTTIVDYLASSPTAGIVSISDQSSTGTHTTQATSTATSLAVESTTVNQLLESSTANLMLAASPAVVPYVSTPSGQSSSTDATLSSSTSMPLHASASSATPSDLPPLEQFSPTTVTSIAVESTTANQLLESSTSNAELAASPVIMPNGSTQAGQPSSTEPVPSWYSEAAPVTQSSTPVTILLVESTTANQLLESSTSNSGLAASPAIMPNGSTQAGQPSSTEPVPSWYSEAAPVTQSSTAVTILPVESTTVNQLLESSTANSARAESPAVVPSDSPSAGPSSSTEAVPPWFSEAVPVTQSSTAAPLLLDTTTTLLMAMAESTTVGQLSNQETSSTPLVESLASSSTADFLSGSSQTVAESVTQATSTVASIAVESSTANKFLESSTANSVLAASPAAVPSDSAPVGPSSSTEATLSNTTSPLLYVPASSAAPNDSPSSEQFSSTVMVNPAAPVSQSSEAAPLMLVSTTQSPTAGQHRSELSSGDNIMMAEQQLINQEREISSTTVVEHLAYSSNANVVSASEQTVTAGLIQETSTAAIVAVESSTATNRMLESSPTNSAIESRTANGLLESSTSSPLSESSTANTMLESSKPNSMSDALSYSTEAVHASSFPAPAVQSSETTGTSPSSSGILGVTSSPTFTVSEAKPLLVQSLEPSSDAQNSNQGAISTASETTVLPGGGAVPLSTAQTAVPQEAAQSSVTAASTTEPLLTSSQSATVYEVPSVPSRAASESVTSSIAVPAVGGSFDVVTVQSISFSSEVPQTISGVVGS